MPTILLVDDNAENRDMLSRRLSRRGFVVRTAVNGEEGLASAEAEPPELILMDMNMPIMDGWEATRRIRESEPDGRRTPIIAITAHASGADRQLALETGCDDHHAKPVDLPRLLGQIEALLKRAGVV